MSKVERLTITSKSGFTTSELLVSMVITSILFLASIEGIRRYQELNFEAAQRTEALGSRLILGQIFREHGDAFCGELGFGPGEKRTAPTEKKVQDILAAEKASANSGEPLPDLFSPRTFSTGNEYQPNLTLAINAAPKGTRLSFALAPETYRCHPGKSAEVEICETVLNAQTRLPIVGKSGTAETGQAEKYHISLEVNANQDRLIRSCQMQLQAREVASTPGSRLKSARRSGIIGLGKQGANLGSDCEKITLIGHWQSNGGDQAPFQGHITRQKNGRYRWVGIGTGHFYGDYELTSEKRCLAMGNPDPSSLIIGCFRVNEKNEVIVDLGPQTRTTYGSSECAFSDDGISASGTI